MPDFWNITKKSVSNLFEMPFEPGYIVDDMITMVTTTTTEENAMTAPITPTTIPVPNVHPKLPIIKIKLNTPPSKLKSVKLKFPTRIPKKRKLSTREEDDGDLKSIDPQGECLAPEERAL